MSARYLVGIDLGTTHTVVAYGEPGGSIALFEVQQLVGPGQVQARSMLPSFRYHLTPEALPESDRQLPFEADLAGLPAGVVGVLAQQLGAQVPGRLVASAKSWLSHGAVDRQAPILPWGALEETPKVSPVDASAAYLAHVRAAWDQAHPSAPLAEQDVVLTVPASFDEGARALTLVAAERSGLGVVRLLEEPQAAFYAFLHHHQGELARELADLSLVLVVDVGGGTADFSLIQVEPGAAGPRLTRCAVGDHLMLGGDNMDLALARLLESRLVTDGSRLPAARFSALVQQCRVAKERLLDDAGPARVPVTVVGAGSRLVGGALQAELLQDEVKELVLDGFAPQVPLDAVPAGRRSALVEFGLPYVTDPALTRHLAEFLRRQRPDGATGQEGLPDAVLFNGGVFRSAAFRTRVELALAGFRGTPLRLLDNPEPEQAVAYGAVAYGLSRLGQGVRIGGGSPRSYFLEVDAGGQGTSGKEDTMAICVLPRGQEVDEEVRLTDRRFALRVGQPVRFRLWAHTADRGHRVGDSLSVQGEGFVELPAIAAVLSRGDTADGQDITVELRAALTEVGTLEMSCVAVGDAHKRYKLEFQLRQGSQAVETAVSTTPVGQLHARFEEAAELIRGYYGNRNASVEGRRVKTLRADLEKLLGERQGWETALLRELFGVLLAGAKRRRRSADHERLWFNLVGYCLRPGHGYPLDVWRVEQVWALYEQGVQYVQDAQVWAQWWIFWRRLAGGLDEAQQQALTDAVAYYLEPATGRPRPRPKGPRAQGLEDMARMVGAFERLPAERKVALGEWLLAQMERGNLSQQVWWSVGRLGARALLHGSVHRVVPPEVAETWLQRALAVDLAQHSQAALAAAQLARYTGDRVRDLSEAARAKALDALAAAGAFSGWIAWIRDGGPLSEADQQQVFGESLPPGLSLLTEPEMAPC